MSWWTHPGAWKLLNTPELTKLAVNATDGRLVRSSSKLSLLFPKAFYGLFTGGMKRKDLGGFPVLQVWKRCQDQASRSPIKPFRLSSPPLVHLFILCRCYFRHLLYAAGRGACLVPWRGPLPALLPDSPFVRGTEEPLSGPLGKMDEYETNGWQRLSPAYSSPTPEVRLRSVYGYVSVSLSILIYLSRPHPRYCLAPQDPRRLMAVSYVTEGTCAAGQVFLKNISCSFCTVSKMYRKTENTGVHSKKMM